MKNLILIFITFLAISCKRECRIKSFLTDNKEFSVSIDEQAKQKILSNYTLDEKSRLSFKKYLSGGGDIYETHFTYDSKDRLKKAIQERYVLDSKGVSRLFVTETSTFIYNNLNPVKIKVSTKINNHSVGFGVDFETEYLIEYFQTYDRISKENFEILNKLSQSMLPVKGGFVLQDYFGTLPTKLIKSVIRKTNEEPSVKTTYSLVMDKENKINEIKGVTELPTNEKRTESYKVSYICN